MSDQFSFNESASVGGQSMASMNNRAAINAGRLPNIPNDNGSIQQNNQNRNMQFGNGNRGGGGSGNIPLNSNGNGYDEFENVLSRHNEDDAGNQLYEGEQDYYGGPGRSYEMGPSPSKTGRQVKIEGLQPAHTSNEPYLGRDALNVIEGEMRQFETKIDIIKRYVEQIVTGQFLSVKKDIDLAPKEKDGALTDKLDIERELLRNQILWIGRVNALFAGCLGTLSGMSMLHIITVMSVADILEFVKFYAKFARNINILFLVLATLALILGIAMVLIYRQKSAEKMRLLHNDRHQFRQQYTIAIAISTLLGLCWIFLAILPYYTIQIHYLDPLDLEESSIETFRGLYFVTNSLFIVAFISQQFATQQGPTDEELEPESDDDGIDTSESEEEEDELEDGQTNVTQQA